MAFVPPGWKEFAFTFNLWAVVGDIGGAAMLLGAGLLPLNGGMAWMTILGGDFVPSGVAALDFDTGSPLGADGLAGAGAALALEDLDGGGDLALMRTGAR